MIENKLIESHCLNQHTTSGIRKSDQIKIALKQPILTRSAMNSNIGIIEKTGFTILDKREIITVYLSRSTIRQFYMPVLPLDVHNIDIVTFLVKKRKKALCRTQRHIVF